MTGNNASHGTIDLNWDVALSFMPGFRIRQQEPFVCGSFFLFETHKILLQVSSTIVQCQCVAMKQRCGIRSFLDSYGGFSTDRSLAHTSYRWRALTPVLHSAPRLFSEVVTWLRTESTSASQAHNRLSGSPAPGTDTSSSSRLRQPFPAQSQGRPNHYRLI